jgi:hypothetical protein
MHAAGRVGSVGTELAAGSCPGSGCRPDAGWAVTAPGSSTGPRTSSPPSLRCLAGERVSPDRARTRRREPRFGLEVVLVAGRTINPPGDELDQLGAWTAQEIPGAGSFLGALERGALTGQCTVPATGSSTVRAGEL